MLSEEKFFEKAEKFSLYPTTDSKYLTYNELIEDIKDNQTDKDGKTVILYSTNIKEQDSFIKIAEDKGYKVLLLDSPIISHLLQKLETTQEKISFARVDSDTIENLIKKEEEIISKLNEKEKETLNSYLEEIIPKEKFTIQLEASDSNTPPFMITLPEFMRRMKDMQATGGGVGMFGNMPEIYNLVVNTNSDLITNILNTKTKNKRERLISQSLDLAKLSQNLLKGQDLTNFIKRSFDLIK
jgi:molecular chaperone HtpG